MAPGHGVNGRLLRGETGHDFSPDDQYVAFDVLWTILLGTATDVDLMRSHRTLFWLATLMSFPDDV